MHTTTLLASKVYKDIINQPPLLPTILQFRPDSTSYYIFRWVINFRKVTSHFTFFALLFLGYTFLRTKLPVFVPRVTRIKFGVDSLSIWFGGWTCVCNRAFVFTWPSRIIFLNCNGREMFILVFTGTLRLFFLRLVLFITIRDLIETISWLSCRSVRSNVAGAHLFCYFTSILFAYIVLTYAVFEWWLGDMMALGVYKNNKLQKVFPRLPAENRFLVHRISGQNERRCRDK